MRRGVHHVLFICLGTSRVTTIGCSYHFSYNSNSNITASDQEAVVAGIILGVLFAVGVLVAVGICIAIFCCKSKTGSGGTRLVTHSDSGTHPNTTVTFVSNGSPPSQHFPHHVQGPPTYQSLYPGTPPANPFRQQTLPNSPPPVYSE
ncbi:uncharacterized protein LOC111110077 [Crassostrea virginica]|uniref:Cysteine and tyrosine-rich protein 1-like n=1 Tax=Crassostrea virginica TaxID=6565 RepID=A0A8B8BFI5_CRAVI|nr:cysteine and tyrosine-rich protein 1-like [Crassostrea virginica]